MPQHRVQCEDKMPDASHLERSRLQKYRTASEARTDVSSTQEDQLWDRAAGNATGRCRLYIATFCMGTRINAT